MKPEILTIATVQVACQLGDRIGNLANAEKYVLQAIHQGAKLVLLPESKKTEVVPRVFGRWTATMPWWAFIWVLTQKMGERAYAKSALRKSKAQAVAKTSNISFQRLPAAATELKR